MIGLDVDIITTSTQEYGEGMVEDSLVTRGRERRLDGAGGEQMKWVPPAKRNPGHLSNDSEKSPAVKSYQEISSKLDPLGSEKNFISISDFVP